MAPAFLSIQRLLQKNVVNQAANFRIMWEERRTRFSKLLSLTNEEDLVKTLSPSPDSAGFIIRHFADVELLFSKNVFKAADVQVYAKTVVAQKDTGHRTNLQDLMEYQEYAFTHLRSVIQKQRDDNWEQSFTTKEFGTKTNAEVLGRIVSHTAHHARQLALILKYGK